MNVAGIVFTALLKEQRIIILGSVGYVVMATQIITVVNYAVSLIAKFVNPQSSAKRKNLK